MRVRSFLSLLVVAVVSLPSVAVAESKKTADRELAGELSAALSVVASEGQRFARARDKLARARLMNMQGLENATQWVQGGNDSDLLAWEVTGEAYRLKLFRTVKDATEDIAARRAATAERRARQQKELDSAKSAVDLKTSQLLATAGSLAALAEPPSGEALSALLKTTLSELAASLGEENPKLVQGLALAGTVLEKALPATQ